MKELIMKILFVVGLILIFIMIIFGIMKIVPKIIGSLSSAGDAIRGVTLDKEKINILTNTDEITSGTPLALSWEHINPEDYEDGVYSFTYECENDVTFQIVGKDGKNKSLICNNPFSISQDPISIELIPTLTEKDSLRDVSTFIYFTPKNETTPKIIGERVVTLRNFGDDNTGDLAAVDVTIQTDYDNIGDSEDNNNTDSNYNQNTNTNPTTYSGPADLAITNVRAYGSIVQFTISNIGGSYSGAWSFNYTLPTSPVETRNSGAQASLAPGQSVGYTLTIVNDGTLTGNTVSVLVDPYSLISESNETNNFGSTQITYSNNGGYTGGGSYNPNDDADLVIKNAKVGYVSGNRFYEDDTLDQDDDAAVQFTVVNEGGEYTGDWRFEVKLPTEDRETYRSGRQNSLAPGASITFTLEFDNLRDGNNQDIDIEVDSDDDVNEESENNNRKSIEVDIRR